MMYITRNLRWSTYKGRSMDLESKDDLKKDLSVTVSYVLIKLCLCNITVWECLSIYIDRLSISNKRIPSIQRVFQWIHSEVSFTAWETNT